MTAPRFQRWDFSTEALAPPERLDNGFLRAQGRIARTGIQIYEGADGKPRRELRLPEEVFDKESLESFEQLPVTNNHPTQMLDARNAKEHTVGNVSDLRRDGDYVAATIMLIDAEAIAAAESGRSQLSNGYTCEMDETQDPKLVELYGAYDSIQRNIRGNHVALCDNARAGAEARLRLDSTAAISVAAERKTPMEPKQEPTPRADLDEHRREAADLRIKLAEAQRRADQAEQDAKELPSAIEAAIGAGLSGLQIAGKTAPELRRATLERLAPTCAATIAKYDDAAIKFALAAVGAVAANIREQRSDGLRPIDRARMVSMAHFPTVMGRNPDGNSIWDPVVSDGEQASELARERMIARENRKFRDPHRRDDDDGSDDDDKPTGTTRADVEAARLRMIERLRAANLDTGPRRTSRLAKPKKGGAR